MESKILRLRQLEDQKYKFAYNLFSQCGYLVTDTYMSDICPESYETPKRLLFRKECQAKDRINTDRNFNGTQGNIYWRYSFYNQVPIAKIEASHNISACIDQHLPIFQGNLTYNETPPKFNIMNMPPMVTIYYRNSVAL